MNFNKLRRSPLLRSLLPLLAISSYGAADEASSTNTTVIPEVNQNFGDIEIGILPLEEGYKPLGLTVSAEFLYLKPQQDGNAYAVTSTLNSATNTTKTSIKSVDGDYDAGVRVGGKYLISAHDNWDINVYWSYLNSSNTASTTGNLTDTLEDSLSVSNPYVLNLLSVSQAPIDKAKAHWKIKTHLADVELGKNYGIPDKILFRPFAGLRYALIHQNVDVQNFRSNAVGATGTEFIQSKTNFSGIGLRAGLDIFWGFAEFWGFYSQMAGFILSGKYDLQHLSTLDGILLNPALGNFPPQTPFNAHYRNGRGGFDLQFGLYYHRPILNNKFTLNGWIGWEQHEFLNLNQRIEFVDSVAKLTTIGNQGDLILKGLTIGAAFSF